MPSVQDQLGSPPLARLFFSLIDHHYYCNYFYYQHQYHLRAAIRYVEQ
jgi:hypothetical protein